MVSDNCKKVPNNSQAHFTSMMTPRQLHNEKIRERIDALLESSVDLDQITILKSEMFPVSEKITPSCYALLQKVEGCAMENARKIQEARELILAIR